jgi:EAL domain-containing protein (putative c-di-GMP-specific phosphodiesterase class I)
MISLPLLRRLRPDRLKIHRSFVRNVSSDAERSAVARSVVALAHTLGLTVVADGIATDLDREFFKWEGCDIGQGDVLARSIAVSDVARFVASRTDVTH